MLGVVGSNLKMVKFFTQHLWMFHDVVSSRLAMLCPSMRTGSIIFQYPTCRNTSQLDGQTCAACCAQQCCDMLHSNVAIISPELANTGPTMLRYVALKCCDLLAGALNSFITLV